MSVSIIKNKIVASDGTERVIDYIDFFDEGQFGAENLYLANRFHGTDTESALTEVQNQITSFFTTADKDIYDINRLNVPNKKFFTNSCKEMSLKSPRRARYRLEFLLRIHFYGDFGYLHIGIPWDKWIETEIDPAPGTTLTAVTAADIEKLEVLKYCWLSKDEADAILNFIQTPPNKEETKETEESVDNS